MGNIAAQINSLTPSTEELGALIIEVEGVYVEETPGGEGEPAIVVVTPISNTKQTVLVSAEAVQLILAEPTIEASVALLLTQVPTLAPAMSLASLSAKWALQQAAAAAQAGIEANITLPYQIVLGEPV